MFEKVNPSHPDKMADRIAGALVDMAYAKNDNPKIAVEVLLGHGKCHIIAETSEQLNTKSVEAAVERISGITTVDYVEVPQDAHLAENQEDGIRCGDNGIFKGTPLSYEEEELSKIARAIYKEYPTDGKYIIDGRELVICQSRWVCKSAHKMGTRKRPTSPIARPYHRERVGWSVSRRRA